jgi:sarcosine oxidase subunit alpha
MSDASAGTFPAGCLVDPEQPLTFTFDGRTISALAGQSIAAALYAAGVRIFTRSFKYHRPRGLFCLTGDCPNCLMQVDGKPNVRTCIEPVRQGHVVCHQNAWPSLSFDVLNVFDKLHRFLPVGFYYKRFHKPRWLWPIFEHMVRNIAGLGRIDVDLVPTCGGDIEHLHVDVCVVGGGPSGMAAAENAAEGGARVLLLDRQSRLGGHLLFDGTEPAEVERTLAKLNKQSRLQICTGTSVFGLYEGNLLGAFQRERFLKIRASQIIIATGTRQRPILFPNNDVPGVFLADAVLRLARLHGVRAGRRAVIVTDNDAGKLARQYQDLGIEVADVVDTRTRVIVSALGRKHVKAVRIASRDGGAEETISCDLLCTASNPIPANELLLQGGMRFRFDNGRWLPANEIPALCAVGSVAGKPCPEPGPEASGPAKGKIFVCLCEDVTVKDLYQAVAEGFDGVETLKRYSTANMGPCQGKVCSLTTSEICARATGREVNAVGTTTSRPPAIPVELGILAAERRHQPIRRTPMHHWHQDAGATWLDAGAWKRPESYGDPLAEVQAVRTSAGLIDVSTLGKIELRGPDAGELLERVYLNSWKDLKVGRARYAAMCTEEGILFDDGVGARLGPEQYYLTATTGNADAVFQWLQMWRATWRLNVVVVNQTSNMAAMNLAGPQARQILATLTDLDVPATAFPYMAMREGHVAGVPCRLLRLGFVGELGYEIHCPTSLAQHLWQTLIQAGAKPFGVEAQRILRLEKGHLIIGQDTDALSNPLDAGLEWMVHFQKPMFHGKVFLVRLKKMPARSKLVGFCFPDERALKCPHDALRAWEGCQVVEDGRPVGRVTSLRFSPTLERSVGLAWVAAGRSTPGARFFIRWNGCQVPAEVAATPFYDPEGKGLKQ